MTCRTHNKTFSLHSGVEEQVFVVGPAHSNHPHTFPVEEWVRSISKSSSSPFERNWIHNPYEKRENPADWFTTKSPSDVDIFYNVATGMLLEAESLLSRPIIAKLIAHASPEELWMMFDSPWFWLWEPHDWSTQWERILRKCERTFNGYPIECLPIRIPILLNTMGEHEVNWDIPHRCYVQSENARIDGFNISLSHLRTWTLHSDRCFVTNSSWESVTLTLCTFVRCTFRDTTFANVNFLNCTFTDVDFSEVIIQNSLISNTILSGTSFQDCTFRSASWAYNSFTSTALSGITSEKSNWTYISYSAMVVNEYTENEKSENWVRMSNTVIC